MSEIMLVPFLQSRRTECTSAKDVITIYTLSFLSIAVARASWRLTLPSGHLQRLDQLLDLPDLNGTLCGSLFLVCYVGHGEKQKANLSRIC